MHNKQSPQAFAQSSYTIREPGFLIFDKAWEVYNHDFLQQQFETQYAKMIMHLARMKRLKRRLSVQEILELRFLLETLVDTNQALH
jgi:hypothetical protein